MSPFLVEPLGGPVHVVLDSVPGSKSIANRALVCAALADGTSLLVGVAPGDDTTAMLDCISRLGAGVGPIESGRVHVGGTGGELVEGPLRLDAKLAGTTSRFVTALAALGPGPYVVDGAPPLRVRPMADLHRVLVELGTAITYSEQPGHLPVEIRGGNRRGGVVSLPGNVTSQYVTALMLVAPYLDRGLRIELTTPLVSRPYLEITRAVMASFGVDDVRITDDVVVVGPGRYRAGEYRIETDASSASYAWAAAAICGGEVTVEGIGVAPLQGDAMFVDLLAQMGCEVERSATSTTVRSTGRLTGITVDMADVSDTVPTLAAVAAFAETPTRITGIGFIRAKESDRIGDVVRELAHLGIRAEEEPDGFVVHPGTPTSGLVATHHDHRLAMAFALVGLGGAGVELDDPGVVSKSWPAYWDMIRELRSSAR